MFPDSAQLFRASKPALMALVSPVPPEMGDSRDRMRWEMAGNGFYK